MCGILFSFLLVFITEAVPKKILDLMSIEGLTRENVASHLQVLIPHSLLHFSPSFPNIILDG